MSQEKEQKIESNDNTQNSTTEKISETEKNTDPESEILKSNAKDEIKLELIDRNILKAK